MPNIDMLKPNSIKNITFLLCCLAALLFPFSVAATNMLFAFALLLSLFSGQLKQGFYLLWNKQNLFTKALLFYLSIIVVGLLWSTDLHEGLKDTLHNGKWTLLPLLLSILAMSKQSFTTFYAALSLGLTLHLFVCVAQMFGMVDISGVAGSSRDDATGYIGHISFGIVYSVWAGCLMLWGSQQNHRVKWLSFMIATWSFMMVFLASGRSGYLVAMIVILYLLWYFFLRNKSWRFILSIFFILMIPTFFLGQSISSHPRFQQTMQSMQAIYSGDLSKAELRIFLWGSAFKLWQQNPIIGVGTGSYKNSIVAMKDDFPMLVSDNMAIHAHPHNLYLLTAARWGTVGFIALCLLLWSWFRIGIGHQNIYLKFASVSALALFIHGFTSLGLEEYRAISMLIFALSASVSKS